MRAVFRPDVPGEVRGELRVSVGYFERRWEERWWWEFFGGGGRINRSRGVCQQMCFALPETSKDGDR